MKNKKDHIGLKIKRLRVIQGLTQEELGERISKTRSLVSYIERTGNINEYVLNSIAEAMGVTVETIEEMSDEKNIQDLQQILQKPIQQNVPVQLLIDRHEAEVQFLKATIANQWQLLHELSKSK